jgi:hypothetical protein
LEGAFFSAQPFLEVLVADFTGCTFGFLNDLLNVINFCVEVVDCFRDF